MAEPIGPDMFQRLSSRSLLPLLFGAFLHACGGAPEGGEQTTDTDTLSTSQQQGESGVVKVGGRLFAVPSPVSTAMALKDAGAAYDRSRTLDLASADAATSKEARALVMGALGADLGYAVLFDDGQHALSTMKAIERLGAELQLTHAFETTIVERFRDNLSSSDSLLRLSGMAFRAADEYLEQDQRQDVSALVVAGGWVEVLYLTVNDPQAASAKAIRDRIAQQGKGLESVVGLLEDHAADSPLLPGLRRLQMLYGDVGMQYTFQEPVTDTKARTTYINSVTTVDLTDDQLQAITEAVNDLRAQINA
ncbi:MAG TPA: hypothetical protein PLC20_05015 [Flavobacteriales bacterium]|nr:hypothetical protein [Flavobacteriales bacterium]